MRRFEYRSARLATGFPIDFVLRTQTLRGLCTDVSDAGICAEIEGAVAIGSVGTLVLRHPECVLRVEAEVAHMDADHVGLAFCLHLPHELASVRGLVALIGANPLAR